jgi:hypothetical protein
MDSGATSVFARLTDARGFQLGASGRLAFTATEGDTTPSVADAGRLVLANAGATSITGFDSFLPGQEVELYFSTSNTTLVHSASLFLKGAVNANPTNGGIITITRDPGETGWVEKSRNF